MNRYSIVLIICFVLVFSTPIQAQEPTITTATTNTLPYLDEDWIFTPPFDSLIIPPLENQTPNGIWLYNLTIPVINGSNQFWVYLIQVNTVIELFTGAGMYYTGPYDILINTSEFVTGWMLIRVYAYIMPAWMHDSFWGLDLWLYLQ